MVRVVRAFIFSWTTFSWILNLQSQWGPSNACFVCGFVLYYFVSFHVLLSVCYIYIYINIYKLLVQEESVRACAFRVSQRHCRRDHRHRHHRWVCVKLLHALVCVCSLACGNSVSSTLYSEEISCTGYIAQITIDSAVGWWRDFPLPTDIFAIAPSLTLSLFFLL